MNKWHVAPRLIDQVIKKPKGKQKWRMTRTDQLAISEKPLATACAISCAPLAKLVNIPEMR